MTNSCEKGRSMIEMLGVLAIVGVLSVGGIAGYSKAMGKYKTNHLIEQLTMLITNIRNSLIGQHDFSDINNNLLINIGAVPADMYDHSRASNDILHAWNGKVTIFPSEASNNKQMAFELYVNNISKNDCIEMVTMDWGKDPSSGFTCLYIGTLDDDIAEPKKKDVHSSADRNEANGIYTIGTHDMAIPLTLEQAYAACTCSPVGCTIGLKYL